MIDYFSLAYRNMQRDWEESQFNNDIESFISKYGVKDEIKYS